MISWLPKEVLSVFFPALAAFLLLLSLPYSGVASLAATETFILSNGLRVVVRPDPSSRLVALQLWVETGAADERPEEAGLAHLLEHILLRGRSEKATGKLTAEVESLGGRINAFTTHDHTVYHLVVPSAHLHDGLRVLAAMIRMPNLDEGELEKEIQVVDEEWKQDQDNPRAFVRRNLLENAYRLHPYGRAVIGKPETFKNITLESLNRFYQRWYTAPNLVLVAVGEIDIRQAEAKIRGFFDTLPGFAPALHHRELEPAREGPRINVVVAPVRQAHLAVGFPTVSATDPDAPAVDLLAFILGRGESSLLAQKVKIASGLVSSISVSTFAPREPGLLFVEAQLEPAKVFDALAAILKELYRLQNEPIDAMELHRAHVNFTRSFVQNRETVQEQANQLGRFQFLHGRPDYEETYLGHLRRLGPEDVQRVARNFFKSEAMSISLAIPEGTADPPTPDRIADLSRSLEKLFARVAAAEEPLVLRETLENGLRIVIHEERRVPMFTVHAAVAAGLLLEDEDNNGLHHFIALMLTQGTAKLSSTLLVREVEQLGGSLSGTAGHHSLSLTGTFPADRVDRGLEIFLEAVFDSTFPQSDLEKKRREILTRIKTRDERVRSQAFRLFYQTLFRNHPYRLDPIGEAESVGRLTREDLTAQHHRLFSPDRVVLTIVGDVDARDLLNRLRRKLSALERLPSAAAVASAENEVAEIRAAKRDTKSKQAHLVLGFSAPAKGHPAYFSAKVLQAILSQAGGRLFLQLRDALGLAYSVGAVVLDDPFQGAFALYAASDAANLEKVREETLREIRKVREEEVPMYELERAKRLVVGNYLLARQTNESRAKELAHNELFDLGADYDERFRRGIEAVTAADVLKFARDYLPVDRYAIAIVGP